MVFLVPCRPIVAQEGEKPAAAQFSTCRVHQKGVTATTTHERIDLFEQILRKKNTCYPRSLRNPSFTVCHRFTDGESYLMAL